MLERELEVFGSLSAYDETARRGTLRYLQLCVERSTGRVQVTLVANAATLDDEPALRAFAARLWEVHATGGGGSSRNDGSGGSSDSSSRSIEGVELHSIWVNLNPTRNNNILSYADGAWRLLHAHGGVGDATAGADHLAADNDDDVGGDASNAAATSAAAAAEGWLVEAFPSGASFVLPPFVFRQANLEAFDRIVADVCAAVPRGARVVEWYAGVGVLGLSLAPTCEWVRCSDVNPPHEAFEVSRQLLPAHTRERVSYAVGAAAERVEDAHGASAAIVDPPRKGLDSGLLEALCCSAGGSSMACAGLTTLVYVSCGFPALMRDADALLSAGWRVRGDEACAHILFPGANHLETVVVFERGEMAEEDEAVTGEAVAAAAQQQQKRRQQPATSSTKRRPSSSSSERGGAGGARPKFFRARDPNSPRARRLAAKRRSKSRAAAEEPRK